LFLAFESNDYNNDSGLLNKKAPSVIDEQGFYNSNA